MKLGRDLYAKEMTRKEFIQFAALAIVGMLGFKNFVTFLLENQDRRHSAQTAASVDQSKSHGFGSSKFGV